MIMFSKFSSNHEFSLPAFELQDNASAADKGNLQLQT
jgi:hypothetical protein